MSTGFGPPGPDPQQPGYSPAPPGPSQQPGYFQQPGYPQQSGYPQSEPAQAGYSAAAYQPGAGTGRNPAGRVALVAGIALMLVSLAQQLLAYLLPYLASEYNLSTVQVWQRYNLFGNGITLALGVVALIAGGIGLHGPGRPKGAAGAGFALGGMAVLTALLGLLAQPLLAAFS